MYGWWVMVFCSRVVHEVLAWVGVFFWELWVRCGGMWYVRLSIYSTMYYSCWLAVMHELHSISVQECLIVLQSLYNIKYRKQFKLECQFWVLVVKSSAFFLSCPRGYKSHFQFTRLVYQFILQGQVHLSRLFSIKEVSGIRIRIVVKYVMDAS